MLNPSHPPFTLYACDIKEDPSMRRGVYESVVNRVIADGYLARPRNKEVIETGHVTVCVPIGVVFTRAGFNPALAAAEALNAAGGDSDYTLLEKVAPKAAADGYFADRKTEYGESLSELIPALAKLREEPHTRQSFVSIRHPEGILPCTQSLQFQKRAGAMYAHAHMRSLDVWRGLPYDQAIWGLIARIAAGVTQCSSGWLTITAANAHVYLEDLDKIESCVFHRSVRWLKLEGDAGDRLPTMDLEKIPAMFRNLRDTYADWDSWAERPRVYDRLPEGMEWVKV